TMDSHVRAGGTDAATKMAGAPERGGPDRAVATTATTYAAVSLVVPTQSMRAQNFPGSFWRKETRMEANIKLGRLFGVKIGLHYTWIIIALLIASSLAARFQTMHPDWGGGVAWLTAILTAALFFASIVVHELSHAMVAKMRGLPVHSITLFA